MNRIAFYAPMKPPTHPVPSGDRQMARNLLALLRHGDTRVDVVSELQSHDKAGDTDIQSGLLTQARAEVERLIATLPPTDLWVTYHNYYKAPDLIGPTICRVRDIPYVQIEASRAKSRLTGKWAGFAQAAHDACDAADVIFHLTSQDHIALNRDKPAGQMLVHLAPFLLREDLPPASPLNGPILSAGMMRAGDKLDSYRLIAQTLPHLRDDWQLQIAGDGPVRDQIEQMMAPFGPRVRFLGELSRDQMQAAYEQAGVFFWPGVNEAYGMVYLEAQAAGLPVVAQNRPGVSDVVMPGPIYPFPEDGPGAMAQQLNILLSDPDLRKQRGTGARRHIRDNHLAPAARQRLWDTLTPLMEGRT
ncbi:MAG: glycosyltransferase [Rhodobacteraceae bacterium]|nr:glycosyltransferase [Paracoccaceae bacterium]